MRRLVIIALLAAPLAGFANLLTNPGFENGDLSGWSIWDGGWRATTWGDDIHSGSWACVDDVTSADGDWRGLYQQVAVTEGVSYDFTGWMRAASVTAGNESWLEIQWFNASGGQISQWQATHLTADAGYAQFGSNNIVAPIGAVTANVRAIVHRGTVPSDTDYFIFDDLAFDQTVPEPSMLGLIGLGVVLLSRIRNPRSS